MILLRGILEHLSRNIVFKRRLPSRFGNRIVFVSPGVALRFWRLNLGKVDPVLFKVASELVKTGDVIWDVGASLGLFTFASSFVAGPTGKVLSIEPDMWTVNLLRRSSEMRSKSFAPVYILPVAISDSVDIVKFMVAKRGRAANFIKEAGGSTQTGGVIDSKLVISLTLDWLLERYPPPNVLKIDVEGAEEKVLRGAKKVLTAIRPRIYLEVFNENNLKITRTLKEFGYTLYDAEIDREKRKPLESASYSTIAYPPGYTGCSVT